MYDSLESGPLNLQLPSAFQSFTATLCRAVLSHCSQSVVFRRSSCDEPSVLGTRQHAVQKVSSDVEYLVLLTHTVRNVEPNLKVVFSP